jgi:uncharacterized protein (DUF305 family)
MNRKFWIVLAVFAALAVGLGVVVKRENVLASGGFPRVPLVPLAAQPNGEDVLFARVMIPRTQHAIDTAALADTRSTSDEVRHLADEMGRARSRELAEILPWKDSWSQLGEQPSGGAAATFADESALASASGSDFDRKFLAAMIEQHEQTLAVAHAETSTGRYAPAIELANRIVAAQQAELELMRSMLKKS